MSLGVSMLPGWGLRVSGDVLIPNLLTKKLYSVMALRYCLLFLCPVLHKNAYAWGCLDCVCGVSGWCLWVSGSYLGVCGRCLGEYRCHINRKQLNRSCHIKLLPFLHSQKVLNFGVSVGCLEDVWKVSGGRVGDSGYCLVYWLSNTNHIWS